MILFTARPQVGKTAFACNVIRHNRHLPVVFFSLEMHGRYIAQRLAAIHTLTSTARIEEELRTTGESTALDSLVSDFPGLAIVDKPGIGLKDMGEALREATEFWKTRPKLVVIDFLELIGGVATLSAVDQVDKVARKLKDFAREHDVVLLVLHQVGRGEGGSGHIPLSLQSGRYGGEMSADYVLGAFRPCLAPGISNDEYERTKDRFVLQFLKTRGGSQICPGGELHKIDPDTMRIAEAPLLFPFKQQTFEGDEEPF